MKQSQNNKAANNHGTGEDRRHDAGERGSAATMVVLAVGMVILALMLAPSAESIILAAGAVLLLLLALAVRLRRSMSKFAALLLLVDVIGVSFIAADLVNDSYAWINSRFVPRYTLVSETRVTDAYPAHFTGMSSLETLDMRGSTISDFSPLYEMTGLKQLDIRDNYAFTEADYNALSEALPGCDILWSIPTGNGWFDSDQREVDLTGMGLDVDQIKTLLDHWPDRRFIYTVPLLGKEFAPDSTSLDLTDTDIDAGAVDEALILLPLVREIDLRGARASAGQIEELLVRCPDLHFIYDVSLMGRKISPDAQTLNLRNAAIDIDALAEALPRLPHVREIDLRGTPASLENIEEITEAWPNISFKFSCDVPEGSLTTEDSVMTVSGGFDDLIAYLEYMDYMPNLELIDAGSVELTVDEINAILDADYGVEFFYGVTVCGQRAFCTDETLTLDGTKIADVGEIERCMTILPNLKTISMCDCGVSEAEMERLFDTYPDIKFIWIIKFGKYAVRTDATAFTTNLWDGNTYGYNSTTFEPLRCCTDLMMLDLGHNKITSLDSFRGLTKLRLLILADNDITDISALQDMKDLEYVELFLNDITDLSPLKDKEKLVDLNIFYNPLKNGFEVLREMPQLKRLWAGKCRLSEEQLAELREALPETVIMTQGISSTGNGWRVHPHYDILKRMYQVDRYIPFDD